MQLHPSPHAVGSLLVLTALVLLLRRDIPSLALTFLTIAAVVICHPISPLILLVFLGAVFIVNLSRRIGTIQVVIAGMLILCFAGWFFWPTLALVPGQAATVPGQAATISGSMFPGELSTTQEYLFGTPFIYRNIYSLNKGIYFLYVAIAVVLLLYILVAIYLRKPNIKEWVSKLDGLSRNQIFLAVSLPLFLILTFLLAEQAHDLIERSLTFIILVLSCLIASAGINLHCSASSKRLLSPVLLVLLLFLTVSFPTVAYSIDAYTSFPESEKAALEFLATKDLGMGKTLAGTGLTQIVLYNPYLEPATSSEVADLVMLRSTGYYSRAMRWDLSFNDNQFTKYQNKVYSDVKYSRIYTSSTAEIYERNLTG